MKLTKTIRLGQVLKKVGKYEILKELGKGGIGIVYLGRHEKLGGYSAIKTLLPSSLNYQYLMDKLDFEAKIGAQFTHPNIVKVIDITTDKEGYTYIIMEYVSRGGIDENGYPLPAYTLDEYIKKAMSETEAVAMFKKICEGLAYAHKQGIIHRDLKPSNILIGEYEQVKISDFGIAKTLEEGAKETKMSFRVGTYAYMAPEQIVDGIAGFQSDIYSMGMLFYEMLTQKYPYKITRETDTEYIDANRFQEPNLDEIINPALKAIIKKSLNKTPQNRYKTVEDLLEDLKNYKELETIMVKVPFLIGMNISDAIKEIEGVKLRHRVRYIDGNDGQVYGQDLRDGAIVEQGEEIEIIVGKKIPPPKPSQLVSSAQTDVLRDIPNLAENHELIFKTFQPSIGIAGTMRRVINADNEEYTLKSKIEIEKERYSYVVSDYLSKRKMKIEKLLFDGITGLKPLKKAIEEHYLKFIKSPEIEFWHELKNTLLKRVLKDTHLEMYKADETDGILELAVNHKKVAFKGSLRLEIMLPTIERVSGFFGEREVIKSLPNLTYFYSVSGRGCRSAVDEIIVKYAKQPPIPMPIRNQFFDSEQIMISDLTKQNGEDFQLKCTGRLITEDSAKKNYTFQQLNDIVFEEKKENLLKKLAFDTDLVYEIVNNDASELYATVECRDGRLKGEIKIEKNETFLPIYLAYDFSIKCEGDFNAFNLFLRDYWPARGL